MDNKMKDDYIRLSNELSYMAKEYYFNQSYNELHPQKSENELIKLWNQQYPNEPCSVDEVIKELQEGFFTGLTGIINPNFLGYILARPVPESHAFDILANATHATPGATHLALSATLIERCVLQWFADVMHITNFYGMFSNCGSVSNLIALKCARDQKVSRQAGITKTVTVYCSEETHYSLKRAWDVLGGGIDNVRTFQCDDLESLKTMIKDDKERGYITCAIMVNLGTTNAGDIEPINSLIEIAKNNDMWCHIDGSYGSPVLMLEEYSYLIPSIQQADSIGIDPHKWLGMPHGTSCIYLNNKYSYLNSFAFGAKFLDFKNMDCITADQCQMGLEGTRRFYGLRVWGTIKLLGFNEIKERVRRSLRLAKNFKNKLDEISYIEVLNEVTLSVIVFRIKGYDNEKLMELTKTLFENNEAFITVTKMNHQDALRCCIINYEITEESLDCVINAIKRYIDKDLAISSR